MKRLSLLVIAVLAFAHSAFAEPSADTPAAPDAKAAAAVVQKALVQPLAAKEREQSKFSRASLPAQERRVRVLDEQPKTDAKGGVFYSFAIDARHGIRTDDSGWRTAAISGCVYADGAVFVKMGDRVRPAAILLGKNVKPAAEHVCAVAPTTATN
jgi:zona occludens toxin (predicted ATPase)